MAQATFDLLTIEEPDVAVECATRLLRGGPNPEDLLLRSKQEGQRRGGPFARRVAKALKIYTEEAK